MNKFNNNVSNKNLLTQSPCIHQVFVSAGKLHARNTCYSDRNCENEDRFVNKSSEGTQALVTAVL